MATLLDQVSSQKYIRYSGKFSLVQIFAEMRSYSSEEIFAVFTFAERKSDAMTTPYQMMTTPHMHVYPRNDTEHDKAKQACATTVVISEGFPNI